MAESMSFVQHVDRILFDEPLDRLTVYDDNRAYVRLPARALRSLARQIWLLYTCSWTLFLLPLTITALALRSVELESTPKFWLHYWALLPAVGVFRHASEALSVSTTSKIFGEILVLLSIDVEVSSL